jgi:hypothetical protein
VKICDVEATNAQEAAFATSVSEAVNPTNVVVVAPAQMESACVMLGGPRKRCVSPGCADDAGCSGHGTCDPVQHVCICDIGHQSPDCSLTVCDASLAHLSGLRSMYYSDRPRVTGTYYFSCEAPYSCATYISGVRLASSGTPFNLTTGTNYRIKLEIFANTALSIALKWRWTSDQQQQPIFSLVPAAHLLHDVVCDQPCVHGCCVGTNVC